MADKQKSDMANAKSIARLRKILGRYPTICILYWAFLIPRIIFVSTSGETHILRDALYFISESFFRVRGFLIFLNTFRSSKIQMIIFLVIMLTILLIKLCLLLLIIYNGNVSFDFSFLNMSAFLIFAQIVILFATFIFGLFYRYQLNKDLEESPLNKVDEFMTEEMYRNIIRQSLNPNDISLKKDFEKQFEQRKAEIRQNSVVNTSI